MVSIPFTRVHENATTPVAEVISNNDGQAKEEKILAFCSTPRSILEITEMLGFKEKKSGRNYVKPLVAAGRLAMTIPDKPNSSLQKYVTIK